MKLVVTIPAFNEEKTIARVIGEIPGHIEGIGCVEILVINDGSIDKTVTEAIKAGANEVVHHKATLGLGVTFRDGLNSALERGADIIVNIDADGQYDAAQIPSLVKPIVDRKADIVLGWRDVSNLDFMPREKKLGNRIATWVTRRLSRLPVKDAQTGFRAFSREAALRMNLRGNYTYVQETLIQASYKGLQIEQVPVVFRSREGKSRLISSVFRYAFRAGRTILATYTDYQPLRFFSPIGGFLALVGLVLGIRVVVHFAQTGGVSPHVPLAIAASLLIIVGLSVIAFGALADMFTRQRLLEEEILYWLKKQCTRK